MQKEIRYTMKTYQSLILAASVTAVLLLAGCEENKSGTPKADTTSQIMQGNSPTAKPMEQFRPAGMPAGAKAGQGKTDAAPPGPAHNPTAGAPANAPARK